MINKSKTNFNLRKHIRIRVSHNRNSSTINLRNVAKFYLRNIIPTQIKYFRKNNRTIDRTISNNRNIFYYK